VVTSAADGLDHEVLDRDIMCTLQRGQVTALAEQGGRDMERLPTLCKIQSFSSGTRANASASVPRLRELPRARDPQPTLRGRNPTAPCRTVARPQPMVTSTFALRSNVHSTNGCLPSVFGRVTGGAFEWGPGGAGVSVRRRGS